MKRTIAVLMGIAVGGLALAQGIYNPLDLGLGVRAEGFGGAYTALAQGPDALLYNPAGLGATAGIRIDSSHLNAPGLYSATWIGGAIRGLGAGLAFLSSDVEAPGGSKLAFSHFTLVAGGGLGAAAVPWLGRFLPPSLSLGVEVKYDQAKLASSAGSGVAVDVGAQTSFDLPFGRLALGAVLQDIGGNIGLGEEPDSWSFSGALGVALVTPMGFIASLDFGSGRTALGLGWDFGRGLEIRAGFRSRGGVGGFSLGLGVAWRAFILDYALTTHPMLGLTHRLALAISF